MAVDPDISAKRTVAIRETTRRFGRFILRILGPLLLTLVPHLLWALIAFQVVFEGLEPSLWLWTALPLGLAIEVLATLVLDARPAGRNARIVFVVLLVLRLLFMSLLFWFIVGNAFVWARNNIPDYFSPLVGTWPAVARLPYVAAPITGAIGLLLLLFLHVRLTVIRRRFRMTTSLILPGIFPVALFLLWYLYPLSPILLDSQGFSPQVERVFPFESADPDMPPADSCFFPRDMYVMPDEMSFVATSGRTFFPSGESVNLWNVDLADRSVWSRKGRVIRRFESTCPDRLYLNPWHQSMVLGFDPDSNRIVEIDYPGTLNGEAINEVNSVLHQCERNRVLIANSLNPAILVVDSRTDTFVQAVSLIVKAGLRLGDALDALAANPVDGRIYVGMWGRWDLVELDGETFEPLRYRRLPELVFEFSVSRDGAFLYAPRMFKGGVYKIDSRTLEIVALYDTPTHCRRVLTSLDGKVLFVLSYLTGELLSFDAETTRLLRSVHIGPKPEALFVTERYVWFFDAMGAGRVSIDFMRTSGE